MNLIEKINELRSKMDFYKIQRDEIVEFRQSIESPKSLDYSKDPVKSSPADRLAENMAKLIDKQNKLTELMCEIQVEISKLEDEFEKLDPQERMVMIRRLKGMSYRKIAEDLYIDTMTAWRTAKRVGERYEHI